MTLGALVAAVLFMVPAPAAAHIPFCTQCVEPHGNNIPPAGSADTCIPDAKTAPNAGVNPDGFFQVGTLFPSNPSAAAAVDLFDGCPGSGDGGTGTFFGTFSTPTNIKYIEANGATPAVNDMAGFNNGGTNGQALAVRWRINGQGDLLVCEQGSTTNCVCCQVPPPPK